MRSWTAAIRAADALDFSELPGIRAGDVRSALGKTAETTTVLKAIVKELAISGELPNESSERQGAVAEFLHRHLIGKGATGGAHGDDHNIPPQVVGAAIERAGKIVDALQYYENLGQRAGSPETKKFAAQRLVRNLERHANYFRSRGNDLQARQRDLRAQRIRRQASIGERALPEYPVVESKPVLASPTEWQRGPFKVILSKAHGRLRIEHTERFETVTIDAHAGSLLGDAAFTDIRLGDDSRSKIWKIEGWDTKITLLRGNRIKCSIQFKGGEALEVSLV